MGTLSFKNINKVYPNGFHAVKDFNLEVADKEFIIFVGPSGCGKTTTLRMVAGLEEISSGELSIDGRVINEVEPKDRDIAMVFQNYALYPHMTVYDNMAFGLKLRKVPKAEIKKMVDEAAKILGLEPLLDRKPKALSGGQRQRVAMGRAIVRNPQVFLMDEPLSNLDAKLRGQMRIELSKLHQRLGTTIIYVTHDQVEAMTLGTRIVVMNAGIVQQVDTPQALYESPANLFVAGFIGSPQMNFFDAKVAVKGNKVDLDLGEAVITLDGDKAKKLIDGGYDGKTVVLGIRPENISDDAEDIAAHADTVIESTVRVYELLGAEVYLYFDFAGANLTARVQPGTKARVGDKVELDLEESVITLDGAKAKALIDGGYDGKTVVMGIRPEDISDEADDLAANPDTVIESTVRVYELLGAEVYLYFDYAGSNLTARVKPGTAARTGDVVKLALNPAKIHIFDKETEMTITN